MSSMTDWHTETDCPAADCGQHGRRTVRVRILAEVDGAETYELGSADLTPEGHQREFAGLLRAAADELEAEADHAPGPSPCCRCNPADPRRTR